MNGPAGPAGAQGPRGTTGPRGAVGPQGETGKSKEFVPIVAFIAYLEKMLMVEANRTETIVFESAPFNEGKAYDTKTGIFTASYSGVYKFSVTIMAQMDSIVIEQEEKEKQSKRFSLFRFRQRLESFRMARKFWE